MVKKIKSSLSAQLLCGVLLSLLVAVAAFGISVTLGSNLLDHTVYGEPFSKQMTDLQFARLQEYVREEDITPDNLNRLNIWSGRGKRIYLTIYQGDEVVYTASPRQRFKGGQWLPQPEKEDEDPEFGYTLTLSDGSEMQAYLYYYAGDAFYFGLLILSAAFSLLSFSVCFVLLIHQKLAYIKKLKAELDILSGGALEYPVTVQGSDELSQLAFGLDQMRRSILSHQQTVERSRQANSQLVTAMSHDLRTPLTSLLGYLELMDREKYQDEDQRRLFVKKSLDKAFRIKTMADQMFEYFLVYAAEWEQPELERQDADGLFGQIWGDYAFSLECEGFRVETSFGPLNGALRINPELLRRAFDNLYSNLLKYADPNQPLRIGYCREGNQVVLTIRNGISPARNKRQSTNIGLSTCQKILQYHCGSFESGEEQGQFTARVRLPFEEQE